MSEYEDPDESFRRKLKRLFPKKSFTTTQMIAYGFMTAILVGGILLTLPISSADGKSTNFIDALFTSTSAICVTGLTTITTATHWSLFGKIVILCLIQFGGLGVVTFTTSILMILRKRITLKDRLLIQDAYNLDTLQGLVKLTKRIIKGTLLVEAAGAMFYMFRFVPDYGLIKGAGISIFTSVSAFCNAGFDLIGDASLQPYQLSPLINITTMLLIIIGGIGYPVWWDLINTLKKRCKDKVKGRVLFRKMELHTKVVLTMTAILIFGGGLLILLLEYNNKGTIGTMSFGNKVMASLFQSVTTRTAGFFTIPQVEMHESTSFVSIILMFIGGSPSGTAGGIKTVTAAVLIMALWASIRNKQDVEIYKRQVTDSFVRKSMTVFGLSFLVLCTSTFILTITENKHFLDLLFETASAIGTVGLTRNVTTELTDIGKIVIIITMYLGRIGPITLALAFNSRKREKTNSRKLPTDKIMVG